MFLIDSKKLGDSSVFYIRMCLWGLFLNRILILIAAVFLPLNLMAFSIDWSGVYRVEGVNVKNSELDKVKRAKTYINHHLLLSPKIHAADGLTVFGRFGIFNNPNLPNSQFGDFFGDGIGSSGGGTSDDTNTLSDTQGDQTLRATQLYLSYTTEFMSTVIGRAPLQFGLGMTHNAGNGLFDHWYDTRDLVATKFDFGNLSLMPMYAKVSEGGIDTGDDIREYMIQMDYDNAETETAFGLFWQWRRSGLGGNDSATAFGSTLAGGFEGENINFYLKRGWGGFHFAVEGGFSKGKTGTVDSSGNEVKLNGTGVAFEFDYQGSGSKWKYDLKTGFAGGDDPSTTDKFEGFFFDRNYDVGLLLFNHVLGQFDLFSTSLARGVDLNGSVADNAGTNPDVEVLSNVIYIAPGFAYQVKDSLSLGSRLVYAFLQEDNVTINSATEKVETDVGFEVDFLLNYKPNDKFTWITEVGLLFPGKAFAGGSNGFDTDFGYGVTTKAAVSF